MIAAALLLASLQASAAPPPDAAPPAQDRQQDSQQQQAPRIEAPGPATAAATQWLALVDGGDLARSWQQAGTLFRSRVTQAAWTQQLQAARVPLGKPVSRQPDGEQAAGTLPDAPPGSYRIVQFDTGFPGDRHTVETVVMAQETGGWRVAGYFVADAEESADPGAPDDGTGSSPPAAPIRR